MGEYTRGQRVALVCSNDEDTDLKPGDKGTFQFTDPIGTHHVKWDSGSGLGIVPEAGDEIEPIDDEDEVVATA